MRAEGQPSDDRSVDETERLIARLKLAEFPVTGTRPACATVAQPPAAPRSRKFGLCRVELRDLANKGMIPGVTKSELVSKAMALTDPLGDMLTRIRNGQRAKKDSVLSPASSCVRASSEVLQREGYIRGYSGRRYWRSPRSCVSS
jgi:ribosomal protein S14